MATDSPFVLIASSPQRFTDTVSGNAPSFAAACCSRIAAATRAPRSVAAGDGIRYGSSAWMLRPVGNTPGPSRRRSPPTAGGRYSPFRTVSIPESSSTLRRSSDRISTASSSAASAAAAASAGGGSFSARSKAARTSSTPSPSPIPATASTASAESLSPKYASKYAAEVSRVGAAPRTCNPSLKSLFSRTPRYAYSSEAYSENASFVTVTSPFSSDSDVTRTRSPVAASTYGQSASRPADVTRSKMGPRNASAFVSGSSR
mmetsp:Transcript_6901/g.25387  ORF Transcript_6901/g.25387 Transcript_6901/m.25387 type:complete len:260 (-) Transcript_6901:2354-3133(-)